MEEEDIEFVNSSSNQHIPDISRTPDQFVSEPYGSVSWATDHGPISGFPEYYGGHPSPTSVFDPCLPEGPSYGSPLSTCSLMGHNESVCTLSYTTTTIDPALNLPVFQHIQSLPNNAAWADERGCRWRPSHFALPIWGPRQLSLPCQSRQACDQKGFRCKRDCTIQFDPLSASGCIQYHAPVLCSAAEFVDLAPVEQDSVMSPDISEQDIDSESHYSESDNDVLETTERRSRAQSGVMKLGRWGPSSYLSYTTIESRQYRCLLTDKSNPPNLCTKNFRRPEHLRRHVITVHVDEKGYHCKVCSRSFSRRDNLREHYWTHLKRGGKVGKNKRMSISELKVILGSKEKNLVKRLKNKLHDHQARRTKATS
jgi:hypothetical protein